MRGRCRGGRAGRKIGRCTWHVAGDTSAATGAFTVIEVLVVLAIILVLAGLILAASSYVHNKGARSRAEAEIAAMSAALENYKADNGVYPSDPATTAILDPRAKGNPTDYQAASATLYQKLSGDGNGDGQTDAGLISYIPFKPNQLGGTSPTLFVKDPFGYSYGYSTAGQAGAGAGYNPTFDFWSTNNLTINPLSTNDTITPRWIKNW